MADPKDFLFNSNYEMDKVMGSVSSDTVGTITLAAGDGTTNTYSHTFGDSAYYLGNYSIAGNNTKAPIGNYIAVDDDYSDINIIFSSAVILSVSYVNTTSVVVSATNNSSSSVTISFDIYLIAKSDQTPYAQPNENIFSFDTNNNYFKIASDTTYSVPSLAAGGGALFTVSTIIIPHSLGYTPFSLGAVEYDNKVNNGGFSGSQAIRVSRYTDDNNLYLEVLNPSSVNTSLTGTYHYRIYYDN